MPPSCKVNGDVYKNFLLTKIHLPKMGKIVWWLNYLLKVLPLEYYKTQNIEK